MSCDSLPQENAFAVLKHSCTHSVQQYNKDNVSNNNQLLSSSCFTTLATAFCCLQRLGVPLIASL
eukprot:19875-Heterococcus_DN1.PRE.3